MSQATDEQLDDGMRALLDGDASIAVRILERAVAQNPDDGDLRHTLARAYESVGRHDAMKREYMQVRLLDAEADRHQGIGTARDIRFIEDVATEVMAALPEPFRSRVSHVPLMLENRPSLARVRSGLDPRILGLFEGPSVLDQNVEAPTRIVVFTHNLLAETVERDELAEEIEITILHEIGHYFGLDEGDLDRLGLG